MPGAVRKKPKKTTYHHGDLRRVLVEEATRFVEQEGHEALKVREIARAAGVSAAAPFRHFEDRTDLLRAVALAATYSSKAFCDAEIAKAGNDPLLAFRAMGLAYVRFAVRHPRLFRLLNLPEMCVAPRDATDAERAFLAEQQGTTRASVERAQQAGQIAAGDPAVYELAGVALAHGLAHMFVDGLLPKEGADVVAEAVIDVLGVGLRSVPTDAG